MSNCIETTIKTDRVYSGKIINLRVDTVELPHQKYSKREIVEHPGGVAIIAVDSDGKIPIVKQFRKAAEDYLLEIPAGKLEHGEQPIDTAKRELLEETGYTADNLEKLTSFYSSPGFTNEIIHIFVAQNLTSGEAKPDEDEYIEVEKYSIEELKQMIEDKEIKDSKSIIAILMYDSFIKK